MGYLKDFQTHISNHDYPSFFKLWEEYCSGDEVEPKKYARSYVPLRHLILQSPLAAMSKESFRLWQNLPEAHLSHEVLKLIIDIQTTNNEQFAESRL